MKKKNTEPLVIEIENERKPRELLLVDWMFLYSIEQNILRKKKREKNEECIMHCSIKSPEVLENRKMGI